MKQWKQLFRNSAKDKVKPGDYFRVVTDTSNNKAEMFLYGYIGQDFWWDEDLNEESITDLAFLKEFRKLEKDYDEIHIRINSPGGSVFHGDAIISAITASDATIHTYNDGMAASMGFDIWVAGDVRHMSENAKNMIHATISMGVGNAKQLRETADMLDKFDEAAIGILAKRTGLTDEEIQTRFYDGADHWLTAKDTAELGLIEKAEDYETEETPEDAEKLTHSELIHRYHGEVVVHTWDKESKAEVNEGIELKIKEHFEGSLLRQLSKMTTGDWSGSEKAAVEISDQFSKAILAELQKNQQEETEEQEETQKTTSTAAAKLSVMDKE